MRSVDIEIGGVGFRVRLDDDLFASEVVQRYGSFAPTRPPGFLLAASIGSPCPAIAPSGDQKEGLSARTSRDDLPGMPAEPRAEADDDVVVLPLDRPHAYRVARSDLECVLDLQSGDASAHLERSLYSFDALLRLVLTLVLPRQRGFLLHSAGLVRDGRAYLFFGVSGSGKSTVAGMANGAGLLSDEIVALRREGNRFVAYGTPFAGDMGQSGDPVSAPIGAAMRLGRPPGATLEPLEPAVAARALLRSVLYFGGGQEETGGVLAACLELARSVPCYHARLRLDAPLWEQLNGLE